MPATVEDDQAAPAKLARTVAAVAHTDLVKSLSVELAASTKVAFTHVPATVAPTARICAALSFAAEAVDEGFDRAVALSGCVGVREDGRSAGVG